MKLSLMRLTSFALSACVVISSPLENDSASELDELLLEKAIPLEEYEARHIAMGGEPFRHTIEIDEDEVEDHPEFLNVETGKERNLGWWFSGSSGSDGSNGSNGSNGNNGNNGNNNNSNGNDDKSYNNTNDDTEDAGDDQSSYYGDNGDDFDDDYFKNKDDTHSFQAYSLKYATCQKVQRFSVDAVQRGEYSSMVSDDIVVLRLCPVKSCSAYSQYGCSSGYGEYALSASDYMTIIMKYQHAKQEKFCNFCQACNSYYKNSYISNTCYAYSNECSSATCYNNDDDGGSSVYLGYLDYMGCQKAKYNGNYYWVNPYCNSKSKVGMGIFYDNYCSQYAGNEVDVTKYLGNGFSSDLFSEVQELDCVECGESKYPPYYNAHNQLCNNIYMGSAKCDSYLAYDLGSKNYNDDAYHSSSAYSSTTNEEVQCSFMESIRYGTYDAYGEIYMSSSQSNNQKASVTVGQKFGLFTMSSIVVGLAIYSCYLHHSMTNLLLKSLSSGLMSKKKKSSSGGGGRRGQSSYYSKPSYKSSSRQSKKKTETIIEESYSDEDSLSTADYTADSSTFA